MAADELFLLHLHHIVKRKTALFGSDFTVENDDVEQVSELLNNFLIIVLVHGLDELMGLLDHKGLKG